MENYVILQSMDDTKTIIKTEEEFYNRLRFYDNSGLEYNQRCSINYRIQGISPFTGTPYCVHWIEHLQYSAN